MRQQRYPKTIEESRSIILDAVIQYRNQPRKHGAVSQIRIDAIWPGYKEDATPSECVMAFHDALKGLAEEGLIEPRFDSRRNVAQSVWVTGEQAQAIAKSRGILLRQDFFTELGKTISAAPVICPQLQTLIQEDAAGFAARHVKYDTGTREDLSEKAEQLQTLCRCVDGVYQNREDCLERNFSMTQGLGSKAFRAMRKSVLTILAPSELEDKIPESVLLEQYHIYQNPPSVSIRGAATLYMENGDRITLSQYPASIAVEKGFIDQITRIETKKLYSVENLTTFHSLPFQQDGLVVYTAGYPCMVCLQLMEKAIRDNGLTTSRHCGDMDAFGFKILRTIDEHLPAKVVSYRMGMEDYLAKRDAAIPMTDGNRRALLDMMEDPYYSEQDKALFRQLLEDERTLEQEALST